MSSTNNKVSLQINLSPSDYPSAQFILPHQLKTLAPQVDEIILVIESKPSKGRFAIGWDENKEKLTALLLKMKTIFSLRIIAVDYSKEVKKKIASYFLSSIVIPEKDFRGGPFYSYFYGIYHCKNDLVLHVDADIFFGGGSLSWVSEACNLFDQFPNLFSASPLPGPPEKEESLYGQTIIHKFLDQPHKFQLVGFSTRIFMAKKSMLEKFKLTLKKPELKNQIRALIKGNANADLPELLIANFIKRNQLMRIDFLGKENGLWSLHPPYRTKKFYEEIPLLINKIEKNNLPTSQYGFYDIVDELIDWTEAKEALKKKKWSKLIFKFFS